MNRIYAYLRASTKEQDANRGKKSLESFSEESVSKDQKWMSLAK